MSKPIVRFAPSPTGRIHIGNARLALMNALFARREGGVFVLRFDDTDLEARSGNTPIRIEVDLAWLGIPPDMVVRQSERFELYDDAVASLRDMGRLYACYETAEELEFRRKRQLARGLPPIYDRAALNLTADDKVAARSRRAPAPLALPSRSPQRASGTIWCGAPSHVDTSSLSDPILVREDGTYLYTLPSIVDDIDLRITHVIRGEDHVTNTAVQIQIFETLGAQSSDLRPHQPAHHRERRGAVEASRAPVADEPARGRARAAGGGVAGGAGGLGRIRPRRSRISTSWRV